MAPPSSTKTHKDLPRDLIHQKILPRLPFKCLNRYKCVSKEICSLIRADAEFAADQSRLADTSSSGFVYMTHSGLSFFPNPELIGVPDPSLNFLNPTSRKIKLVSSTNGLLLLYGEFNGMKSLCVCNPATKEMAVVPNADGEIFDHTEMGLAYDPSELPDQFTIVDPLMYEIFDHIEMGLAYDPSELPDQFTIVDPLMHEYKDGPQYRFNVFHSNTGKWTYSSQSVDADLFKAASKAVCAKGVIYWCCGYKFLLWYDTKRDLAGSVLWPQVKPTIEEKFHVGVYAGEITCCHTWICGIEVYSLTGGSRWDKIHATSWDGLLDKYNFSVDMQLRRYRQYDMFFKRYIIFPVGFDGQFVYIAVREKDRDNILSWLFSWETATGEFEEKGLIDVAGTWYHNNIFTYANSMAKVPQILNGNSS